MQTCLLCTQCFPPPDVIPPELGFICGNGNIEPTEACELPAKGCDDGEICTPGTCDACTGVRRTIFHPASGVPISITVATPQITNRAGVGTAIEAAHSSAPAPNPDR